MKKLIGIVGLKKNELSKVRSKYSNFKFIDINDKNLFDQDILEINALIVLYEYPVRKKLSIFLKKNFKIFKKLEWVHLTRAGVDECEPYLQSYHFKLTAGKKYRVQMFLNIVWLCFYQYLEVYLINIILKNILIGPLKF